MPNAAELTTVISEATGADRATVAWVVRVLREAHLITSGGRGRNVVKMTPADAIYILVAMLFTDRPVDAVKSIGDAKRLVFTKAKSLPTPRKSVFNFAIDKKSLKSGASDPRDFFDALVHIIETIARSGDENVESSFVQITFNSQDLGCQIEMSDAVLRYTWAEHWAYFSPTLNEAGQEAQRFFQAMREQYRISKMGITRTWFHETIYPVAKTFAEA